MNNFKLSIILLTYNHEKYISTALDSILNQKTKFNYELIIINDASTDETLNIIKKYIPKFNFIKVLTSKKNYGGQMAWRFGKRYAQGEYTASLEGDDYWTCDNKLQRQMDILEKNPNLIGVSHNTEFFNENSKQKDLMIPREIKSGLHTIKNMIRGETYFHTSSYLWRNIYKYKLPKEHYYSKKYCGDTFLAMLYARHGDIYYLNEPMSVYRLHPAGEWSSMPDYKKNYINICALYCFKSLLNKKYTEEFSRLYDISEHFLSNTDTNKDTRYLKFVIRLLKRSLVDNRNFKFIRYTKLAAPIDYLNISINFILYKIFTLDVFKSYNMFYKAVMYKYLKINPFLDVNEG